MTLVLLKTGADTASTDSATMAATQNAQLLHLFQLNTDGKLPLFGPVQDENELRGICIFNSTDTREVKKMLDADPHVRSGHLRYEISSWFGIPGDRLP